MSIENTIFAVDRNAEIVLYVWYRCSHSGELMKDLQQLPEAVSSRIAVVDMEDVLSSGDYPPSLTCTPCMYVSAAGPKVPPRVMNGRRQILMFCKLRAAANEDSATAGAADAQPATKGQISTAFENATIREESGRDIRKIEGLRQFGDNFETAPSSGKRERLFDEFIDDPTVSIADPRLEGDPKQKLEELMRQRGYA